jgi:S-DNA-T family DNA segregation ATPase FtsK/SpoIIIE
MARDPYRREMRRMRRAWRKGEYAPPIVLLGIGEPWIFYALAVASRWCYRHRSAFYPFGIGIAEFIVAAMNHGHHARYWIPVTVLAVTVTAVVWFPLPVLRRHPAGRGIARVLSWTWNECGIGTPNERIYAGACLATGGGWLAAAIARGPAAEPLPVVAGIATVLLAIPWWFHRRRREKVRVEKIIEDDWPRVAEHIGLNGADIVSAVVDLWGWTARVHLKKGMTSEQAIAKIPAIESGMGFRPGSVRVFPDESRADHFVLRVIEKDPHAGPVPWPGPSITSITQLMDIGVSESGQPVRVLLLRRNLLVGGIMGSGKSGVLNVIIAALAACNDVVLWGVDMKGGMELQPWASCFERLAFTPEQASQLFRDAVEKVNDRAARMAAEGKRLWEPAPNDPALIIIADEYAELPEESHDCADSVARRGRAVAVNLLAATQRPTQDAMGKNTAVRSQMDVRICLRVRERRDVDLILGQGAFNSGWHAHQLAKPGEFLISDPEHTAPERNRAYLITDGVVASHAAQCAASRPRLAASQPDTPQTAPESPQTAPEGPPRADGGLRPETALWDALADAGPEGVSVAELEAACGMRRRWVYYQLQAHARDGRAVQVARGRWRAVRPSDGLTDGDGG